MDIEVKFRCGGSLGNLGVEHYEFVFSGTNVFFFSRIDGRLYDEGENGISRMTLVLYVRTVRTYPSI